MHANRVSVCINIFHTDKSHIIICVYTCNNINDVVNIQSTRR